MLSRWKIFCTNISQRWIFTIMAFLGLCISTALRALLSITITEMTIPIEHSSEHKDDTCQNIFSTFNTHYSSNESIKSAKRYDWDEYTQGIILSSFYYGYAVAQLFYGSLSERFGGKYLLGQAIFIPAVLTFLTPLAINWGESTSLIIFRIFMGSANAAMYPASSTMVSKWATPTERTKMATFIYAGPLLGIAFGNVIPALLIRYTSIGWPAVFYVFGSIGIIWFPIWILLCYNCPEDHPFLSEKELEHLRGNLESGNDTKYLSPPFKYIFTSVRFWAFTIGLIGSNWSYFTMISDLPKYMSSVVGFSIESNGYLSALPYVCMWLNTMFSTWISDKIIEKGWLGISNVRKLLTSVSLIGASTFLIGASYAECDNVLVVVMFIIGITLSGSSYPSLVMNALDLSPNYAGTVMALGNGIACFGGILSPYIVGVLTPNQTIGEWRLVFWIVFGFSVFSNVIFILYGSGDVQEWDDPNFGRKVKEQMREKREKEVNVK